MPVSDPKLQACYAIFKNHFPWRSALWRERNEEIQRFARLATWAELDLTESQHQLYSNGVKPKGVRTMKSAKVALGTCGTCGKRVFAYIDEHSFLVNGPGPDESVIRVEGHCGRPGHAAKVGYVTKDEFDTAKDGDTI